MRCAASVLIALVPLPLLAVQVEPISIRNEHRLNFGEFGSLEAGAVAARVSDPAAVWYNPGRVAAADAPSISGNASVYESASTRISATDGTYEQSSLNTIPGYVGANGRLPFTDSTSWMWGFGVFVPLYWDSSLENRNTQTVTYGPPSPGPYELSTVGRVSSTTTLLVPGVALGYRGADGQGIGISLLFPYYQHRLERNVSETSESRGSYRSYWEIQEQKVVSLRVAAGASATIGPVDLGIAVKSPSVRLASDSSAEWHAVRSSFATGYTSTTDAYVAGGSAEFKSPLEATLAAAYHNRWLSAEIDLTYLGEIGKYDTVGDTLPITSRLFNTTTAFDATTTSTGTPGTMELRQDLNVAIGLSAQLSPTLSVHAGYAIDKSQVENSNEFTALNIHTVSTGLLYRRSRSSMFGGAYYQWSNTGSVDVFNTARSRYEPADVSISALGLVLGASYYID